MLWRCRLGGRKGIRPVKKLSGGVLAWLCVWSWCHCHSLSVASVKSRLVLPFWYRLTRVVPDKGPLNGCLCVCTAGLLLFLLLCHCWLGNSSGIRSLGSGFTPAWWNSRIEGLFNSYRARVFVIVGEFHVIKCCCSKDSLQLIHSAKRHRFSCSFPNKTTVCRASDDCLCDRSCST